MIGSGISGGWAAKELCEKGLKVLMLERGRPLEHITDYADSNKPVWEYPHRGSRTQQMIKDYPVLKRDYPLMKEVSIFGQADKDCPHTEVKRFDWFRGYHVGGRSLMWEGKVIDGVIGILKPMPKMELLLTGRFVIKTLLLV